MKREIRSVLRTAKIWAMDETPDIERWLADHAFAGSLLLLAHADDGVIWGRFEDGRLITADSALPHCGLAALRSVTLQTCRLFGETGELMIWRSNGGYAARLWLDGQTGEPVEYFDESQILWGTQADQEAGAFTLVSDGVVGLRHAVPLHTSGIPFDPPAAPEKRRPLRLTLRHYLSKDPDNGALYIGGSRLVRLFAETDHTQEEAQP